VVFGSGVAGIVALFVVGAILSRIDFGTAAFWGSPDRINLCGRRHYPEAVVQGTPASFISSAGVTRAHWRVVAHTVVGRAIYAVEGTPVESLCAMALSISRGGSAWASCDRSGGP